jgi:outer membrane protein assembly factor BamB
LRHNRLVAMALALVCVLSLAGAGCAPSQRRAKSAKDGQPISLADSSWPSRWYDAQHTNRSAAVGPDVPAKTGVVAGPTSVVGPDGILYGDDGAVDPTDGATLWSPRNPLSYPCVPAVLNNGTIIFAGVDKGLRSRAYAMAVDASGREIWRTWLGEGKWLDVAGDGVAVNGPTIGRDGTIYVSASAFGGDEPTGAVYALDPASGAIRWAFSVPSSSFRAPVLAPDGTIYAPDDGGHTLYALNAHGSKRWSIPAQCEATDPAVGSDGTVYLLVFSSVGGAATRMELEAISPDGTLKWKVPSDAQGSVAIGPDGTLYVVGEALHAVSSAGRELWSVPVANFTSAIVDGAETVYVCDGDQLVAMNPDGSQKWRIDVGGSGDLRIGPNETMYVGGTVIGPARAGETTVPQ